MFNRVREFHKVFGQHIADQPGFPPQHIRDLRRRLLLEELNEFCKAYNENDLIEMADGLADMCYVIAGTCVSYGICPEGEFVSPYEDVIGKLDVFINLKLDRVLTEDFDRYEAQEKVCDLHRVRDELMTMMTDIFGIALHLGIPINSVFTEVHRSNLSKVEDDGRPRYREDGKLLKGSNFSPPNIRAILYPEDYSISME